MTKIEIPEASFSKDIPSSFDEMSQDDFIRFARLYLELQSGAINLSQLKTEMVFQFLEIKSKWRLELLQEADRTRVYENVFRIGEKLDFFFTEVKNDSGKIHLKVNFPWTKTHIKSYNGFLGPADTLGDLSFLEYKNAHVAAAEYLNQQNMFDLDWLCAILYRKPFIAFPMVGIPGRKPKYDEFKTSGQVFHFANWPLPVKYAILLDFLAFEEYIRTGTFRIDGKDVCFKILFEKGQNDDSISSSVDTGLTGLLFNLAESGVFGNVKATSEQNLFDVLYRLFQLQIQYQDLQKRNKK